MTHSPRKFHFARVDRGRPSPRRGGGRILPRDESSLGPAVRGRRPRPVRAAPAAWRLLLTPPAPGAANMALDEALMARSRDRGELWLRVYGWSEPTLSLGRHQTARGRYDLHRAAALGVRFVRRPTGGRAVLHHREITYCVTAPDGALGSLRESYRRINRLLVDALRRLGVEAGEARASGPAPRPGVAPCFEEPVAGEIVAGGRKLVGSAQWRDRGALLQHGSILVADDQALAGAAARAAAGRSGAGDARGAAGPARRRARVRGGARRRGGGRRGADRGRSPSWTMHSRAPRWRSGHEYESDAWTWRR